MFPFVVELEESRERLVQEVKAFKKSDKFIMINPMIEIKGLSKLKKALYLSGEHLLIKDNIISMKGNTDSLLTLLGNTNFNGSNVFTLEKSNKK
jgi:hypothetical protein